MRAGLLALKYIFRRDLDEKLGDIAGLLKELPSEKVREHLEPLATYVAATTNRLTAEEMEVKLSEAIPKKRGGIMPTLLETWIQKGLQQGLQQGKQEQAVTMTLDQLDYQLGSISERARGQVSRLPLKKLEELNKALRSFKKASDLHEWLRKNKNGRAH